MVAGGGSICMDLWREKFEKKRRSDKKSGPLSGTALQHFPHYCVCLGGGVGMGEVRWLGGGEETIVVRIFLINLLNSDVTQAFSPTCLQTMHPSMTMYRSLSSPDVFA